MLTNATSSGEVEGPVELLAISACALVGALVSAVTGFGGAVTYLAFAAAATIFLHLDLKRVIMFGIFRSMLTNPVTVYLGGRRHCDFQLLRLMLPGLLLGAPLGQYVLAVMEPSTVRSAVGALCLFVVTERLLKSSMKDKRAGTIAAPPPASEADPADEDISSSSIAGTTTTSSAETGARHRTAAAIVTGLAAGFLGASIGTSGVPIMCFVSYFPLHKTTTRTMVCAVGIPPQTFAILSLVALGVLVPSRDWMSLLAVFCTSAIGVYAGNRLHDRVDAALGLSLLLFFLAAAGLEMVSENWAFRLTAAALLGLILLAPRAMRALPLPARTSSRWTSVA